MAKQESTTRVNIERFNGIAASWDSDPHRTALARAVAAAILAAVPLTGKERALEFGCGTGLVTGLLAERVAHVLAVDSSSGMLEVLRGKLKALGIHNVELLEADLARGVPEGPFDLVFSSMVLHHIEDVAGLLARVYGALAPRGHVAFADLVHEDGSFHAADVQGVMHQGFEPAEFARWLERADFSDVQVHTIFRAPKLQPDGRTRYYPILLATARRTR